ncbi:hypothetical protein D3C87_2130680 [compost metagenome]
MRRNKAYSSNIAAMVKAEYSFQSARGMNSGTTIDTPMAVMIITLYVRAESSL